MKLQSEHKCIVDTVVVIPIGPNCNINYIIDTINSFKYYSQTVSKIVLADDSHNGTGNKIKDIFPDLELVLTSRIMGKLGGLYINLSLAYLYVISNFSFGALLRLDTDALIIGPDPEIEALDYFRKYPETGIIGQHLYDEIDIAWPKRKIFKSIMTWKFIKNPKVNRTLKNQYSLAQKNGYKMGESIFGGSCFLNQNFLLTLENRGELPNYTLGESGLEEDHIFSLLAYAVGYKLGSLGGPGEPFGCAWKGLPASPDQLISDKRKIIHSTRRWGSMNEDDIRTFFRKKRI